MNASACWPHIRSRRSGARLASSSTRETSLSSSVSASARAGRDADGHIGRVADGGVAFGELALALVGGAVALDLALAGALPDPGAQALLGRRLGRGALGAGGSPCSGRRAPCTSRSCAWSASPSAAAAGTARERRSAATPPPTACSAAPRRPPGATSARARAIGPAVCGAMPSSASSAAFELALARAPAPRVIGVADRGGQPAAGQHAGDGDRGRVEQLDQLADLAGEHRERAQLAAAHPC